MNEREEGSKWKTTVCLKEIFKIAKQAFTSDRKSGQSKQGDI